MYSIEIFKYSLFLFGLSMIALFIFLISYVKDKNIAYLDKIPRNVTLGVIVGALAVIWCIPQAIAVFSAKSTFIIYVIAVVGYFAGVFFLDYLFARAFAGFLILLAHYFLALSFTVSFAHIYIFSSMCYIIGCFGIVIGGIPHLLRDLLRKMARNKVLHILVSLLVLIFGLIGILVGLVLAFR